MEEEEKGLRVEEMEMRAERTRQGLRRTKQVLLDREEDAPNQSPRGGWTGGRGGGCRAGEGVEGLWGELAGCEHLKEYMAKCDDLLAH